MGIYDAGSPNGQRGTESTKVAEGRLPSSPHPAPQSEPGSPAEKEICFEIAVFTVIWTIALHTSFYFAFLQVFL